MDCLTEGGQATAHYTNMVLSFICRPLCGEGKEIQGKKKEGEIDGEG